MSVVPEPTGVAGAPARDEQIGLTAAEATSRLLRDGPNRLPLAPVPLWRRFGAIETTRGGDGNGA